VAALPIQLDWQVHNSRYIGVEQLVKSDQWKTRYGLGADVFMVGRFIDHDGGQTNKPAARFGHISIEPTPLSGIPNSAPDTPYFCLDMHSRSGFSGSPVVVYNTMVDDLGVVEDGHVRVRAPRVEVLGIHCGQFPELLRFAGDEDDADALVGYSGMTYALPAWEIRDLLNCAKFVAQRSEIDEQWKRVNVPCPEQSESTSAGSSGSPRTSVKNDA